MSRDSVFKEALKIVVKTQDKLTITDRLNLWEYLKQGYCTNCAKKLGDSNYCKSCSKEVLRIIG